MNTYPTKTTDCAKRREMRSFYGALVKLQEAAARLRVSRGNGYGRAYSYYIRNS